MRILRYFIILLLFSSGLAQPPGPGMGPGKEEGPMRERIRRKIKTIKIWRLSEAVGLTPEQSEKFFPVYNKFQDQQETIEKERRTRLERVQQLADDPQSRDSDIREAMDEMKIFDQRTIEIRDAFLIDIGKVLSLRQQAKLLVFEERFNQDLQDLIREIRHDFKAGPGRDRQ